MVCDPTPSVQPKKTRVNTLVWPAKPDGLGLLRASSTPDQSGRPPWDRLHRRTHVALVGGHEVLAPPTGPENNVEHALAAYVFAF